ncbi:MAG: periplasmic heavy metal sensor [Acidobacteriota bacterium]|nr:periplasmic heavy metal sensor [Acidobacteriota bacterium]
MKKIGKAASIAALIAGLALGQGFRPRDANPPDPATMIANQVARLTALLDLSTSQAAGITTILTNAQSTVSNLQTTLAGGRKALNTAVANNDTATIDSTAAAIGAAQGQILGARSKAAAAIYAMLTATQQTKVTTLGIGILTGGPGGPAGRGPGGPPGPPPGE